MVDVGAKTPQHRYAIAEGRIIVSAETLELIQSNQMKKGDVLTVAQIAGVQAAKNTSTLIPLCHPLSIDHVKVQLHICENGVEVQSKVSCIGRTGVEMEALTAVSVALLTVYDMCKAVDKNMKIEGIRLVEKVKKDVI
jgi:cyclic pyranopterin phosphate synthase